MKTLLIALFSVVISGCVSTISKNTSFDDSSSDGLAIVEVHGQGSFHMAFAKYDSDTNLLKANAFTGHETLKYEWGESVPYKVLRMDAGLYVLKYVSYLSDSYYKKTKNIVCLSNRTFQFEVFKGKIINLGYFQFNQNNHRIKTSKGDIDSSVDHLRKNYPKVSGEITRADIKQATFSNGSDVFGIEGNVCGGYNYKNKKTINN